MGTFTVTVTVCNPPDYARTATVACLVDTGAASGHLPAALLMGLGVLPFDDRPAVFAAGRRGLRRVGRADFISDGRETPALVVFGGAGAPALLGAMTLQGLGVDPSARRLIPGDVPMAPLALRR